MIPVIVLGITQLELENERNRETNGEPILCYVYLGDKIQDVRGISRDETRIKAVLPIKVDNDGQVISNKDDIFDKQILIQVKQNSTVTLGYVRIPLSILKNIENQQIKTWFPIFQDKDHDQISKEQIIRGIDQKPRILLDLKITEELPSRSPLYQSPQRNPFKSDYASQSPIEPRDDLSNGTYEEISENIILIQGRPQQESMRQTVQSTGQQIFIKKKKTYTQSANPQNQPNPSNVKPRQPDISQPLIRDELLVQLPQEIDKVTVKHDLITLVDQSVKSISELNISHSQEISSWYTRTKQISLNDQKDLIINDQRQNQLNQLQKDTNTLINYRKDQDNIVQQLETQTKLLELHGQHQTKREKLERLQETVSKLKNEMTNLQNNQFTDNKEQNRSGISEQIQSLKQELLIQISQIKQGVNTKTLQDQVHDEIDNIKNTLLTTQIEVTSEIEKLASEKLQNNQEHQAMEIKVQAHKHENIEIQQQIDRQQIKLSFLQKQIISEQQSMKNVEIQYRDLIKKNSAKLADEKLKVDQIKTKIDETMKEHDQLQENLSVSKLQLNEQVFDRINDGKVLQSSIEVQKQTQEIKETLKQLNSALEEKLEAVQQLKNIHIELSVAINSESLEKIISVNRDLNEKIKDKNDLLQTKELKNNEVLNSIEQVNAQIDWLNNKQDIHKDFKKSLNILVDKERALVIELQKLRKIHDDYNKWKEESQEKLQIQQQDFLTFDNEMKHFNEELREQHNIEQIHLNSLLSIKTKSELESYMRDRLSQIREMQATLRGKDHEIDTLELIQSQKDSIILELEEQAGKFKEVIKEVHYESQKNDRVENALIRYQDQHPTKVDIKKLGDGYYKFGTRRIYIKLDNESNMLLVRIATKEYITLSMFIIENEGIELQKLCVGKALMQRFK